MLVPALTPARWRPGGFSPARELLSGRRRTCSPRTASTSTARSVGDLSNGGLGAQGLGRRPPSNRFVQPKRIGLEKRRRPPCGSAREPLASGGPLFSRAIDAVISGCETRAMNRPQALFTSGRLSDALCPHGAVQAAASNGARPQTASRSGVTPTSRGPRASLGGRQPIPSGWHPDPNANQDASTPHRQRPHVRIVPRAWDDCADSRSWREHRSGVGRRPTVRFPISALRQGRGRPQVRGCVG